MSDLGVKVEKLGWRNGGCSGHTSACAPCCSCCSCAEIALFSTEPSCNAPTISSPGELVIFASKSGIFLWVWRSWAYLGCNTLAIAFSGGVFLGFRVSGLRIANFDFLVTDQFLRVFSSGWVCERLVTRIDVCCARAGDW